MRQGVFKVLSIAGSDNSCDAGLQADLAVILELGGVPATALTLVTAQNFQKILMTEQLSPLLLLRQLEAVFEAGIPDAIKVGALGNREILQVLVDFLQNHSIPLVVDPVLLASSGACLGDLGLRDYWPLFELARVITPNLPEAESLFQQCFHGDLERFLKILPRHLPCPLLLKGGHNAKDLGLDILLEKGRVDRFYPGKILEGSLHGGGCVLSTAIACHLAQGLELSKAILAAKAFTEDFFEARASRPLRVGI